MRRALCATIVWVLSGCASSAQTGPAVDRCPVVIHRVEAEGTVPDDLDHVEREWAVRLFDRETRCYRVSFTAPVRSEIGPCGARATLSPCDGAGPPIARYALAINTCPTRRGCEEMVPATLDGTYGQEPAACAGRDRSELTADGSRLTMGTEGAVFVLRAPEQGQGRLPFDTMVLRVGGAQPASAELSRACRSESVTLPLR